MGACHLCHRCSWSSLRQCHWEGARGCQCRSRDAQESGKYDKAKLISSDILIGSQTKSKSSSSAFWQKVTNPFTGAFIVSVMRNPLLLPIPFSPSYGLFTHLSKPLFPADGLCSRLSLSLSLRSPLCCSDRSFLESWGGHRAHMCWGEWLNNQLSFLAAQNELPWSRG